MKEPFDLKRFTVLSIKKIWMVLLSVALCSLFFGAFYFGKEVWLAGPAEFRNETFYYITFDREQVGDIHDYYNDYTWNDVLDSDLIAGVAAEKTGLSKSEIAKATEIPTMSDIRFFWVVVNSTSQVKTNLVAESVREALIQFAEQTDGFTSIEVYDQKPTYVVENNIYLLRWFVFGGIVGLIIGVLYLLYENALDDSMYVEKDVEKRFGVLCAGVLEKNPKQEGTNYLELKANLSKVLEGKKNVAFAEGYENARKDIAGIEEVISEQFLQAMVEEIAKENNYPAIKASFVKYEKGKERDYFMALRDADTVVWMLPFGRSDGARLDRAWKNLHFWNCEVDTVILIDISKSYYKSYYLGKGKKRK